MPYQIISTGIDIGTTTTQLIFSRLTLEKSGGYGTPPRIDIINREVIYKSNIYITPLTEEDIIDAEKAAEMIRSEYRKAGFSPSDITSGAVIITGESSRKRNAQKVTEAIAHLSGDFVVAAAGPDFESLLAGRGSGADRISKRDSKTVLNIDIGGGTSNFCLFADGEEQDCACYDIGGRMIRMDEKNRIERISPKLAYLLQQQNIDLQTGQLLSIQTAEQITDILANLLAEAANLKPRTRLCSHFITNHALKDNIPADIVTFSGGVAACMENSSAIKNPFAYHDLGVLLANSIRKNPVWQSVKKEHPAETVRATVIGAGNCSMEVSGSTIFIRNVSFPIRNLPVIQIRCSTEKQLDNISAQIAYPLQNKTEGYDHGYAIYITGPACPSFQDIEKMAEVLSDIVRNESETIPVITNHDFAKALGQAIRRRIPDSVPLLVLDGVSCKEGDFVDIGEPVGDGIALPVIVKTLIFDLDRGFKDES